MEMGAFIRQKRKTARFIMQMCNYSDSSAKSLIKVFVTKSSGLQNGCERRSDGVGAEEAPLGPGYSYTIRILTHDNPVQSG